jgi:hypothetical protein
MNYQDAIEWVQKLVPGVSDDEAREMYETYRAYRDEGQSDTVSRQYAGLL